MTAVYHRKEVRDTQKLRPYVKQFFERADIFLLVICTLKQGLSIALIRRLLPTGLPESEVREFYDRYAARHALSAAFFEIPEIMLVIPGWSSFSHNITSEFTQLI